MELNEKLTQLRKEKSLTQMELAEEINVSRQAISKWEIGKTVPSMENLICLSKLYDVPLDYLINERDKQKTDGASTKENVKQIRHLRYLIPIVCVITIVAILTGVFVFQKNSNSASGLNELKREKVDISALGDISVDW
jgi:transcriptional regulator with XRE-family HTH domain